MDFEERLKRAIARGQKRNETRRQEAAAKALSEAELKRIHSQIRLQLSEHIEKCLQRVANYFPGYRIETIYGDRGWGAACSRDDVRIRGARRENGYSRLEMTVRPYSDSRVIDLAAKGAIHNREVFNRNYFEPIEQCDAETFIDLIDVWTAEFAELYAAAD